MEQPKFFSWWESDGHSIVHAYAIRRRVPYQAREDYVQDVLIDASRRCSEYDAGKAGLSTWIIMIARNVLWQQARREQRPNRKHTTCPIEAGWRVGEPFPEDLICTEADISQVPLSGIERQIVDGLMQGKTMRDIAKSRGVAGQSLETRAHTARRLVWEAIG